MVGNFLRHGIPQQVMLNIKSKVAQTSNLCCTILLESLDIYIYMPRNAEPYKQVIAMAPVQGACVSGHSRFSIEILLRLLAEKISFFTGEEQALRTCCG